MLDYAIVKLEQADAPAPGPCPWFRYVITNGVTTLEGMRAGTQHEVTEHAQRCADRLNNRNKPPQRW